MIVWVGRTGHSSVDGPKLMSGIQVQFKQSGPIALAVELTCQAGEVLALVGPSGSGKTTILRAIAGLYQPLYGLINCQGEIWQDSSRQIALSAYQRAAGLVFQNYALFPHLTALENVQAALAHLPKALHASRARELLQRVHLDGLADRYPDALSGGQQQRVAMARALAREPKVLLLDEPFSAVDQVTRRRLYRELNELRRSLSMPIILVTHDLDEATLLADRLCILHKGCTLQSGTPLQVTSQPVSARVARLLDQQNLFNAQIIGHDDGQAVTWLNWRGQQLEARYQPDYLPGQKVSWMIDPANVLLHRRRWPSNGDRENPLFGFVAEYMALGPYVSLRIELDQPSGAALTMTLPSHAAQRNALALGERVSLSLLTQGIHLMPYDPPWNGKSESGEHSPNSES